MFCGQCDNGWIKTNEGYDLCKCVYDLNVRKFFEKSGSEDNYFKRLENLENQYIFNGKQEQTTLKEVVQDLTTDRKKLEYMIKNNFKVILGGSCGTGKTQMALTISIEASSNVNLLENENIIKYQLIKMEEFSDKVFDYTNENKKEFSKKIADIRDSSILIIDDLGVELNKSDKQKKTIYDELSKILRIFNGVVIITTNETENLSKVYKKENNRLSSVLVPEVNKRQHGEYNVLFFDVELPIDRRLKKNNKFNFI